MTKKLTVNTLAMGNLKTRKKQYILLIIGIILAMVFSSGIMFFLSCTKTSNEEYKRRTMGNFYGYYFAPEDFVDVEQGVKDGLVGEYGYAHILGYAYTDEKELDRGTPVAWLDEGAKKLYYVHFIDGRYPEAKGEIAIEKDAALRLGIKPEVGQEITVSMLTADGEDYLDSPTEKTYTVVGILTDKRKNIEKWEGKDMPQFAAAFVCDEEEADVGGKEIPAVFFNPTEDSNKEMKMQMLNGMSYYSTAFYENFIGKIYENAEKLYGENYSNTKMMYNVQSLSMDYNGTVFNDSLLSITLAAVLMVASCIGIINAFSTNLKERKKQIGMLRAVGATRRQIINIFGRETFIISLICTPIGVMISYFGVKLYAKLMGDGFIFTPDFTVLILTAAVSVVCVMLASLIPLLSASKISPMQAIRNVELSRKMKRKKIKTQKSFTVPKLLAQRSMKFYRSRQIGVTVILIITICASSFGFAFLKDEFVNYSWENWYTTDYVVRRSHWPETANVANYPSIDKKISLNNIRDTLDYPLFSGAYGYKEAKTYIAVDEYSEFMRLLEFDMDYGRFGEDTDLQTRENAGNAKSFDELYELWFTDDDENYQRIKKSSGTEKELLPTEIQGYDSVVLESNKDRFEIIDGRIDVDKLNSGEEIILVTYKNAGFEVRWDEKGRVFTFGIQDMDEQEELTRKEENYYKDMELSVLAEAQLDLKAGDTVSLHTVYSDLTEIDWGADNALDPDHLTVCDREVRIGAIIKPFYFSELLNNHQKFGIITSATGMDKITGFQHGYESLGVNYEGEITDEGDREATEYLDSVFAGTYFEPDSGYADNKENDEWTKILMISLLSIVILLFSVCASMVNNALTAKIRESKKEIGTLRAVGASVKELTGAYIRQLISMFSWGMGIGLIGYAVIHFGAKLYYGESYTVSFLIWPSLLICVLLCIICSVNLYVKIRQEMKHSIVENIRELG